MRWLITGGCGFVGTNLAHYLLDRRHEVAILDNLSRFGSRSNLEWLRSRHPQCTFIIDDVRDPLSISEAIRLNRPAAIAHLAGQVAATTSIEKPRIDFEINAGGTFNVMEAVRRICPDAMVFFSSTNKVYGSLETVRTEQRETRYVLPDYPDGLDETLPVDPSTPYGCSKAAAEHYVRDYYRMYGIRTVVFRHSSMYGGRQYATSDQGWVGWFCQQALRMREVSAEPFPIAGDGMQVRDLLHADDLVKCYEHAAHNIESVAGTILNIGGGPENSMSLLELFAFLEDRLHIRMAFEKGAWRTADQKVFVAKCTKAASLLGWRPLVTYERGLEQAIEWALSLTH